MSSQAETKGKLNNAGLTLVELIIVIAIVATVTGAMVLSTGIIGKSRLKSAVNTFLSEFSTCRTTSMSMKDAADLVIRYDANANTYYIKAGSDAEEKLMVGTYDFNFKVYDESNNTETTKTFAEMVTAYGSNNTLTIRFKRSGKLQPMADDTVLYLSEVDIADRVIDITYETGKYKLG